MNPLVDQLEELGGNFFLSKLSGLKTLPQPGEASAVGVQKLAKKYFSKYTI